MACMAIGHSHINGNNVTRHRHPFQQGTTTQSPTWSPQMNKPAFLLKPLDAALRHKKNHTKNVCHHNPTTFPQATSWKPHHHTCCRAVLLFTIHLTHRSPPHAAQLRSVRGRGPLFPCCRGQEMDVATSCNFQSSRCGSILHQQKRSGPNLPKSSGSTAAPLLWWSVRSRRRTLVCRCGQMPSRCDTLTQQHQRSNRTGGVGSHPRREWTAEARAHGPCFQPQQLRHVPRCLAQDTWPIELRRATLTDINLVPFILETTGALDHTPENLLTSS